MTTYPQLSAIVINDDTQRIIFDEKSLVKTVLLYHRHFIINYGNCTNTAGLIVGYFYFFYIALIIYDFAGIALFSCVYLK